jgi:hypothetical protein
VEPCRGPPRESPGGPITLPSRTPQRTSTGRQPASPLVRAGIDTARSRGIPCPRWSAESSCPSRFRRGRAPWGNLRSRLAFPTITPGTPKGADGCLPSPNADHLYLTRGAEGLPAAAPTVARGARASAPTCSYMASPRSSTYATTRGHPLLLGGMKEHACLLSAARGPKGASQGPIPQLRGSGTDDHACPHRTLRSLSPSVSGGGTQMSFLGVCETTPASSSVLPFLTKGGTACAALADPGGRFPGAKAGLAPRGGIRLSC